MFISFRVVVHKRTDRQTDRQTHTVMSRVLFEGGGYTACPEERVEMTEESPKKERRKVREAVTELDLLPEDVDRLVLVMSY